MTPSISAIVACHNYGRYLAGALDSVLGQTHEDLEVIVVDDGSSDETREVIGPFLADPRVRYYRTEHRGQSPTKNLGIRMARAPLLAFLDADDLWMRDKLQRQLAVLKADPGLGVVYTRRLLIDPDGRQLAYPQPSLHRGKVLEAMFRTNFVCFSSALVRRSAIKAAGPFDESLNLAIDYDLWLRLAMSYRFDYVDEPLVQYRTGHANLSQRVDERLATVDRIMTRFLNERGGRSAVSPRAIRRAYAEIYYHRGLLRRHKSRLAALGWNLRALAQCPSFGLAWRGLLSLPFPEAVRRCFRRLLGKPADWSVREPVPLAQSESAPQPRRLTTCTPHV
jgi:glycosyltransferase involved in cell wall biosynthesis